MDFKQVLKRDLRFLLFGFSLTLFCNFGQTFFLGFYTQVITTKFSLTNSDFGLLYGVASIFSAASLIWFGRLIDQIDLRVYTLTVLIVLMLACFCMSQANSIVMLGFSLYLLRLTGQGLMPHISSTSMARYFDTHKGKAVGISGIGISLSQIIFPNLAVYLIATYDWRLSWQIYGWFVLCIVIPLTIWMLQGHAVRHQRYLTEIALSDPQSQVKSRMQSSIYAPLFTDVRFYLVLLVLLGMPAVATGFFFFQEKMMFTQGLAMNHLANTYIFMSIMAAISSYVIGVLIEKFSTIKMMPFFCVAGIIAYFCFSIQLNIYGLYFGMIMLGISLGALHTVNTTIWEELYGKKNLGAIRAITVSMMVFTTSLTPVLMGFLLDSAVTLHTIYTWFAWYLVLASAAQFLLWRKKK